MARYWYSYTGPNTPASRCLTVNWSYVGTSYPTLFCSPGTTRPCAIYARGAAGTPSSGTHPSASPGTSPPQISANLCSYISNTIGVSHRYPATGKAYLYNKA